MKIAITGGIGFVGSHFSRRMLAEGHAVVLVSRNASRQNSGRDDSTGAIPVSSDLSDIDVLTAAFAGCEAVAHCAQQKAIRPLAVDDLVQVSHAALVEGRLSRQTIAITGAEQLYLSDAARRVAEVLGRRIWIFPAPLWFHYALALVCEATMKVPLVARAQVRILSEGVVEPATACDPLPADLTPARRFTPEQIRGGLPEAGPFGVRDLRCSA